jgi:hypothetical protein
MKTILTLIFVLISSLAYGQLLQPGFEGSSFSLSYLSDTCISLSDDKLPDNPHEDCQVNSIKPIFDTNNETWYMAFYWHSGKLGDIENLGTEREELRTRYYDYQSVVIFVKEMNSDQLSVKYVISSHRSDGQMRTPTFVSHNDRHLLRISLHMGGGFDYSQYYAFNSDQLQEIESHSLNNQIAGFLPDGYYHVPILTINIFDLIATSYVFDREWAGRGDLMDNAKKLGTLEVRLIIENQRFVIDSFYFQRDSLGK